jgi:Zn-dependent M28 family amino/carboxypeptidase
MVWSEGAAGNVPAGGHKEWSSFTQEMSAMEHGAAALLIIRKSITPAEVKSKMYVNLYQKTQRIPTFYISEKLAERIIGEGYTSQKAAAQSGNYIPQTIAVNIALRFNKTTIALQSSNVLGILEGTDMKDQYIVLTAHYDHLGKQNGTIWYGADDDGSGTVAILELAKAFTKAKATGKGPRRSILFMTVSGEEKGLWGSDYYSAHPALPLDKTSVNLNIDMIGRIDPGRKHGDSSNYIYIVGDDKVSSDLKPISEAVNKKYSKLELDYKYNDPKDPERIYYRSDHYNFAKKGVPVIFYFSGLHPDYHKPSDTPDKINYTLLQKRAQLIFFTTWEMANRNDMLKRDIPLQ